MFKHDNPRKLNFVLLQFSRNNLFYYRDKNTNYLLNKV
jgi:hypothetical protein